MIQPETWTQSFSYPCLSRSLHHDRQKCIAIESILNSINTFYRTKIERMETDICYQKYQRHLKQTVKNCYNPSEVTITSKRGSLERYLHSTTSQTRNSRRRTGKKMASFLVSVHLMKPGISLTMFVPRKPLSLLRWISMFSIHYIKHVRAFLFGLMCLSHSSYGSRNS